MRSNGIAILLVWFMIFTRQLLPSDDLLEPELIESAFRDYIARILDEIGPEEAERIMEELELLMLQPLQLNRVSESELLALPFLERNDVRRIIRVREEREGFSSLSELLNIEGIDFSRILLLLNFVFLEVDPGILEWLPSAAVRSRFIHETVERRGYKEGVYAGSPLTSYQRISMRTENVSIAFLAAKSAGEASIYEHLSGYINVGIESAGLEIVLGDFRVLAGQGLLLWGGFGLLKGGNVTGDITRRAGGIRPAVSRYDDNRFRGAAITLYSGRLTGFLFGASTMRSATVREDGSFRTITYGPLFRTPADLERKNKVREEMAGFHLRHQVSEGISVGVTFYSLQFNRPMYSDFPNRLSGHGSAHAGIDFDLFYLMWRVSGEVGGALPLENPAWYFGLSRRLIRGVDIGIMLRNYPAAYISHYGSPIGERSGFPEDESGFYLAGRFRPAPRHLVETYIDIFRFSNQGRTPGFPSPGSDLMSRVEIPLSRYSSFDVRYRQRIRGWAVTVTEASGRENRIFTGRELRTFRLSFDVRPLDDIAIRIRGERLWVNYPELREGEGGSAVFSDLRWNPGEKLQIDGRVLLFRTESFDSRLYIFEYDVPGTFRTRMLNGEGSVWYLIARYSPVGALTISAKYSEMHRIDRSTIGSGFEETDSPLLGVVVLQIDARF